MAHGLYIPADEDRPVEVRDFAGLEDYQRAVGGWIESVDVPPLGATIFVNEEGLLRGLTFNPRATFLWWYQVPHVRHRAALMGDAVVVGLPNKAGETTDLPATTMTLLTRQQPYRVELLSERAGRWVSPNAVYHDHFEAVTWAMIFSDKVPGVRDARIATHRHR